MTSRACEPTSRVFDPVQVFPLGAGWRGVRGEFCLPLSDRHSVLPVMRASTDLSLCHRCYCHRRRCRCRHPAVINIDIKTTTIQKRLVWIKSECGLFQLEMYTSPV
ncbi:hypothetical protein PoB_000383600 [Plakobranchus ocellatus]|uniref:Uncharacterized protein n=1 Tax=Plakobranchus ocellatus TaxID=259542 RepID=A0AAV3XLW5_9GAST|nr:hypothetical protein PoB_000383600 [Plakobranchus ocellatus]